MLTTCRRMYGSSAPARQTSNCWQTGYSSAASPVSPWNRPAFIGFRCSSCWSGAGSRFTWSIRDKPSTLLAGERDPRKLAKLRHERCKKTEAQIARALHGNWREEHLFALKQALELYQDYRQLLRDCDAKLEAHLATFTD